MYDFPLPTLPVLVRLCFCCWDLNWYLYYILHLILIPQCTWSYSFSIAMLRVHVFVKESLPSLQTSLVCSLLALAASLGLVWHRLRWIDVCPQLYSAIFWAGVFWTAKGTKTVTEDVDNPVAAVVPSHLSPRRKSLTLSMLLPIAPQLQSMVHRWVKVWGSRFCLCL